jgi:hypothetical protein
MYFILAWYTLLFFSPITFIDRTFHVNLLNMVASGSEVSGCEVSGSEVSGCNSFQALIGSSALGKKQKKKE